MKRTFETRSDWYEYRIKPLKLRRTLISVFILIISLAWLQYTESVIPTVIIMLAIVFIIVEWASVKHTKNLISSMSIVCNESGLKLCANEIQDGLFYPWNSIRVLSTKKDNGKISCIKIEDISRKRSKINIMGYENMDDLCSIIGANIEKS